MSIFATNYIIDENTGEATLVKHLNQDRVDRGYAKHGHWNKSGRKTRILKEILPENWIDLYYG